MKTTRTDLQRLVDRLNRRNSGKAWVLYSERPANVRLYALERHGCPNHRPTHNALMTARELAAHMQGILAGLDLRYEVTT